MKRISRSMSIVALLGLTAAVAPAAHADVLFSSLPAANFGLDVGGPTNAGGSYYELANAFVPSASETLTSARLGLDYDTGNREPMTISIYSNVGGRPGVVLDSAVIPANTISTASSPTLYTVNFSGGLALTAGTTYFIDARTTGDARYYWDYSDPYTDSNAPFYRTSVNGSFLDGSGAYGQLAFEVNGAAPAAATPEPGSVALLVGMGTVSASFFRKRFRK